MAELTVKQVKEWILDQRKQTDAAVAELKRERDDLLAQMGKFQTDWGAAIRGEKPPGQTERPKHAFGQLVRCIANGNNDHSKAIDFASKAYGKDSDVYKTLTTNVPESGGFIVPENYSADLIELLRARSVVRRANAQSVPMANGSLTLPKLTGGATAAYAGEAQSQNASQQTLGQLHLVWKKLRTFVPLSRELIKNSSPSADAMAEQDAVAAMGTREDVAFLRGDGLDDTPKGMRNWVLAANATASSAANDGSIATLAEIEDDLRFLVNQLEQADVRMIFPALFMAPRTKNGLMVTRDTNGNLGFPELRTGSPSIWNIPAFVTTNVPINLGLGGGSNQRSELMIADMADAIIGEDTDLTVEVSNEASYQDANGNTVSAFARDEVILKVVSRHDFGMRHDESVAVKTAITYGTGSA